MFSRGPDMRPNSQTNLAESYERCDAAGELWGQLLLLVILSLVALMRLMR